MTKCKCLKSPLNSSGLPNYKSVILETNNILFCIQKDTTFLKSQKNLSRGTMFKKSFKYEKRFKIYKKSKISNFRNSSDGVLIKVFLYQKSSL